MGLFYQDAIIDFNRIIIAYFHGCLVGSVILCIILIPYNKAIVVSNC